MENLRTLVIPTPRLVLRPWQRSDLDVMAAWPPFPDPLDAAWNWARVLRDQGTLDLHWVGRNLAPRRVEWTITQPDGTVVGHLGIRDIGREAGNSMLGIGFGYPYIGQGYGTEALAAFFEQYYGPWGFATLRLEVALHNERAVRLYERLGFRTTRTFWYQPELPDKWDFFADQRYDPLRHLFRRGQDGMYMQCVEMELNAQHWAHGASM
jgi:RimJ/RimL family protein N-acetyltransferase